MVWINTCPTKARRGTDKHTWMGIDHLPRATGGMEGELMMRWHLSRTGRAFLAELTAEAKVWGPHEHPWFQVQSRSHVAMAGGFLLLIIIKGKQAELDTSKCWGGLKPPSLSLG